MIHLPILVPFALVLVLAGCADGEAEAPAKAAVLRINAALVGTLSETPIVEAAGTAALRKEIPLGFTSPGRVARILVQEGDRVRRGQVLAVLDTTSVGASLEAARAEAERANAEFKRLRTLYAQGWITKPRLEAAEAAARSAEANLSARRFALETARVIAPSDGLILARQAEPAQIVDAGTPIVTLGDSSSGFVLRALMSDRDAVRVLRGAAAEVSFEALPGAALQGRVIEIGGRSDRGSGAFTVEIQLSGDPRLRSGLAGRARISVPPLQAALPLVVPPTAIFAARAEEGFVYVIGSDRKVRARAVRLGRLLAAGQEVLGGLQPGETIALSGLDRLRDGQMVDPVSTKPG
jgi:RND family efflux transporter MFP subunit